MGFEILKTSDSGYNNAFPLNEDDARDPPEIPPQLQNTLVGYPANVDSFSSLPLPQNAILNHLYIENREPQRSVVALGYTHRFRTKFVTAVLYKPVQRRGATNIWCADYKPSLQTSLKKWTKTIWCAYYELFIAVDL